MQTVLLYGATGYSGRMLAAEAASNGMSDRDPYSGCRMILAGRDADALRKLGREHGMEARVFGLDDRDDIAESLDGIDVVLNAAGPFAFTAETLAKAALQARCHYVDINGEVDVYRKLDDLIRFASQRGLTMVASAGHMAAASDSLLDAVLGGWTYNGKLRQHEELGAIRIALSRIAGFSRGSAETVTRSLREQVAVFRRVKRKDRNGQPYSEMVLWHEPVGKLERTFDFGANGDERKNEHQRIASAANLVDTLTARHTVERYYVTAHSIESYMEAGSVARFANQVGAIVAPLTTCKLLRAAARTPIGLFPVGPTAEELTEEKHAVVLEIEDRFRQRRAFRLETPNVYQLTAQLAVAVAQQVALKPGVGGWRTPAEYLRPLDSSKNAAWRGCHIAAAD
jgi:short subunit dehydrogenase-like uncharacterized protein